MPTPLEAAAPDTLKAWVSERRSIRRYRDEALPAGAIERLLDAARFAPSAHNRQPWRFAVLDDAGKTRLANAMGERLRADRVADGDAPEDITRDVERSRARIVGAPAVIAVCFSLADMDRYPDARRADAERLMAVQSTAMAVQNLLLLAHAEGLAACWMCAPLFCPDTVRAALELPPDWQPQALITLGYPACGRPQRERRAIAEFVRDERPAHSGAGRRGRRRQARARPRRRPAAGPADIVVNTADDFVHLGLHISPDIDSVLYALADLNDPERGWGLAGETWNFMAAMEKLGGETWFHLGDRDLATHVLRTHELAPAGPCRT